MHGLKRVDGVGRLCRLAVCVLVVGGHHAARAVGHGDQDRPVSATVQHPVNVNLRGGLVVGGTGESDSRLTAALDDLVNLLASGHLLASLLLTTQSKQIRNKMSSVNSKTHKHVLGKRWPLVGVVVFLVRIVNGLPHPLFCDAVFEIPQGARQFRVFHNSYPHCSAISRARATVTVARSFSNCQL